MLFTNSTRLIANRNSNTWSTTSKTWATMPVTLPTISAGNEVSTRHPSFDLNNRFYRAEDGTNIDNWSMEDLMQCVQEYYAYC